MLAGSDVTYDQTAELYSPPYLNKGPRPTIQSVNDTLQAGTNATISYHSPVHPVVKAILLRTGAITHSMQFGERRVCESGGVDGVGLGGAAARRERSCAAANVALAPPQLAQSAQGSSLLRAWERDVRVVLRGGPLGLPVSLPTVAAATLGCPLHLPPIDAVILSTPPPHPRPAPPATSQTSAPCGWRWCPTAAAS
jgi:hypothetical protein